MTPPRTYTAAAKDAALEIFDYAQAVIDSYLSYEGSGVCFDDFDETKIAAIILKHMMAVPAVLEAGPVCLLSEYQAQRDRADAAVKALAAANEEIAGLRRGYGANFLGFDADSRELNGILDAFAWVQCVDRTPREHQQLRYELTETLKAALARRAAARNARKEGEAP